ncbi:hypothetical protein Ahy_B01g052026 [Arachis hypogaea]|uniref:protein-serine/threonine phosphatase n=1 Tax=Arachis hypogaea TaxID=3818 RepID=A0A445ANE9_ARAHY|nr:hypothetical protein Ahy_B01g052026 [Arachis hypogaea]
MRRRAQREAERGGGRGCCGWLWVANEEAGSASSATRRQAQREVERGGGRGCRRWMWVARWFLEYGAWWQWWPWWVGRLDGMQQLCKVFGCSSWNICQTSKNKQTLGGVCKLSLTFKTFTVMMVDTGSVSRSAGSLVDMMPEKDDDGRLVRKSEDGRLSCVYSSFRGKKVTMEDLYDIKTLKIGGHSVCLFGIFDGHGGSRAVEYLKEHIFDNLMKHSKFFTNAKLAISETYQGTDSQFLDSGKDTLQDDGSTTSTTDGKAIGLSEDHKPNRIDERKRIESAGTPRIGGVLAMSRAFGNRMLKQFVDQEIDEQTKLLILASDGLWDVVPNDDAIALACTEEEPEAAARKLTEAAFSRGSAGNITCIVVRFHHDKAEPIGTDKVDVVVPEKVDTLNL